MSSILDFFAKGFEVKEILTVTEWAERYRYLSSDISAEGGLYRVSRTPYFKQIMDDLSDTSRVRQVSVMAGAQLGKSEAGNNFLGYIIDRQGGSVMVVQPTEDSVKKFLRQRIEPMIDNCHSIKRKFDKSDDKRKIDNTSQKDFTGGTLTLAYSTSAATLASTPVKYLFLDEVDRFKMDVGNEGDAFTLALRRTNTFSDKKILAVSTPTLEHNSRIYEEYLKGDQNHYFMTCPHCSNDEFEFTKDNFKYEIDKNDFKNIGFQCNACGRLITEKYKSNMVKNGRWKPTNPSPQKNHKSYYINSAYSLLGYGWNDLAQEVDNAKGDDDRQKSVINTLWGLPYKENVIDSTTSEELVATRVDNDDIYPENKLNKNVVYLNMTVDTQDNRLCYAIVAYTNKTRYVLKYDEIYGDVGSDHIFKIIDQIADAKFYYEDDNKFMKVKKILVDSGGHYTTEIYNQVNKRDSRWVAIKGVNTGMNYRESDNTYLSVDQNGKPFVGSKKLVLLNVMNGKKHILSALKKTNLEDLNYIHIDHSRFDITFFDMLTSEIITRKSKNGILVDEFKKIKDRNEALDLLCYSYLDAKTTGIFDLSDENIEKYKELTTQKDMNNAQNNNKPQRRIINKVDFDL